MILSINNETKIDPLVFRSKRFIDITNSVHCNHLPASIDTTISRFPYEPLCDKIFCAEWINEDTIVVGTKDNKAFSWNLPTNSIQNIALPELFPVSVRSIRGLFGQNEVEILQDFASSQQAGIHDISFQSQSRLIALSGGNGSNEILILNLPLHVQCALIGHHDWVFATKFLTPSTVISASRDSFVRLWKLPDSICANEEKTEEEVEEETDVNEHHRVPIFTSTVCRSEHDQERVRCLELCGEHICTASVSGSQGRLLLWDSASLDVTQSYYLEQNDELAAMATSEELGLIAIGNRHGATVFDIRESSPILRDQRVIGDVTGIRSVTFRNNVLILGSGQGGVCVLDPRRGVYKAAMDNESGNMRIRRHCEDGFIDTNTPQYSPFDVHFQAVYAMKFSSRGSRLFVGGGQLMVCDRGCYGAIWG